MRLAVAGENRDTLASRDCGDFADQPAFTDASRPDDVDHAPGPALCFVQDGGDGVEFPGATDQARLASALWLMPSDGPQLPCWHRLLTALDMHQLRLTEQYGVLNEPCGGLAEHHPT